MKRAAAAILTAVMIWFPNPPAFAAAAAVSVKAETVVRGPGFTLGDIAEVTGDSPERVRLLKELPLGDAPAPGTTLYFTPASLEPRLLATRADFSDIAWSVPANFKITTLSQPLAGRKIAEQARAFLQQASMGAEVAMLAAPADIQAPLGSLELAPELAGPLRYNGPTTVNVAVRADGRTFLKIPVQFEVRRYLDVVVSVRNLNAGEILTEQSVRLERVDAGRLPAGYQTEIDKVLGLQARVPVAPGSVLYGHSLTRPILVRRGETVRLTARVNGIAVEASGTALSQGAAGDTVRVQNSTTNRVLTGRVQDDKSVLVLNQQGG